MTTQTINLAELVKSEHAAPSPSPYDRLMHITERHEMKRIDEAALRSYGDIGAITSATATKKSDDDGYTLAVSVAGKNLTYDLYGSRRQPRTWKSLDRLVRFLQDAVPSLRDVHLKLPPTEHDHENDEKPE